MKIFNLNTFLILWSGISLIGCAAGKQQAMLNTIGSPEERPATFDALREDFNIAERDQVNLIAPDKFQQAKKYFSQAEAMKAEGQPEDEFNEKLSDARTNLDSAMAFSKSNKDRMNPLIEARQIALTSGAAETTNKDLNALEEKYLALVKDLDTRNSRADALDQITPLTQDYQDLTVKTLQAKHLGEAKNTLGIAKAEGAEDLVPKTLKETEAVIKRAGDYIAQNVNPPSMKNISQLGKEASAASTRLLRLTRETKASKALSPEDRSLNSEAVLQSSKEESARLQGIVAGSNERISKLESRTKDYSKLEQRDLQSKNIESVRELFDEEEAKVFRQGNSLIISLKKINFPVNESDIPSQSFGLLKKVQTAISSFKEPSVVVEGHTDSTGSADLNKALSTKRAEAVKEYFLSNSVISPERVETVGYGSEKPLASNKSSAGRAINRRIDVIIK
ncbi:MAG: hypothetical protein COV44_07530 [Deltaproteobacteria bacterium CG11_big_fil_rev_8_21_14_0_20_45_16]|nr:MAG: hypothetical protein COV44_07530 [Deltaproteobacteria bacterium CG11_big_fil_rev_8_21_14_0_20_45_16]